MWSSARRRQANETSSVRRWSPTRTPATAESQHQRRCSNVGRDTRQRRCDVHPALDRRAGPNRQGLGTIDSIRLPVNQRGQQRAHLEPRLESSHCTLGLWSSVHCPSGLLCIQAGDQPLHGPLIRIYSVALRNASRSCLGASSPPGPRGKSRDKNLVRTIGSQRSVNELHLQLSRILFILRQVRR